MTSENVRFDKKDQIAYVTIDRPKVLNALNMATMGELRTVFTQLKDDRDVRAVILTGAGEKSFVAGADIGELQKNNPVEAKEYTHRGQAIAISQPPPRAHPLMQAITGLPRFSIRSSTACPRCVYSFASTGLFFCNSPMSAPATNDFSPAPVRITARTSRSSLSCVNTVRSSPIVAMFRALSTLGRSIVT